MFGCATHGRGGCRLILRYDYVIGAYAPPRALLQMGSQAHQMRQAWVQEAKALQLEK
jgi:hypothetical protein